jgi:hypothetical protein
MQNGKNNAIVKEAPPKLLPVLGKNEDKIIVTWNPGNTIRSRSCIYYNLKAFIFQKALNLKLE